MLFEPFKESESCNMGKCPGWATWGDWSECTRTCGAAEQDSLSIKPERFESRCQHCFYAKNFYKQIILLF